MTTIAEEGNRRIGEMSVAEMKQCVMDIKGWFIRMNRNSNGLATVTATAVVESSSAKISDIERLQKALDCSIPRILEIFLCEDNGSIYIFDKKLMNCNEILEILPMMESSSRWKNGYVPFCGDSSEAFVIDSKERVFEWDVDDGVGDQVSSSLTSYIETYRNQLLSGAFEFVNGIGAIEKRSSTLRK